jgi:hypothetical protein
MKRFRETIIVESDNLHQMPHEHLHAETHKILQQNGYAGPSKTDKMHVIVHRWEHHGYEDHNFDHIDMSDRCHEDETNAVSHLKKIGWTRDHTGDVDTELDGDSGIELRSYTHPNNARLHLYNHYNFDHFKFGATMSVPHPDAP